LSIGDRGEAWDSGATPKEARQRSLNNCAEFGRCQIVVNICNFERNLLDPGESTFAREMLAILGYYSEGSIGDQLRRYQEKESILTTGQLDTFTLAELVRDAAEERNKTAVGQAARAREVEARRRAAAEEEAYRQAMEAQWWAEQARQSEQVGPTPMDVLNGGFAAAQSILGATIARDMGQIQPPPASRPASDAVMRPFNHLCDLCPRKPGFTRTVCEC
jgi:hypothetical protein